MFAACVVYTGFTLTLVGLACVVRPLTFLRIRSRAQGGLIVGLGFLIVIVGVALPVKETRTPIVQTELDQFLPLYQFREFHSVSVAAPKRRVYFAIKAVTPDEILLFRALTWIRRFGRPGPPDILNAPAGMPILDVATRTSFLLLAEESGREIVLGTLVVIPPGWRTISNPTPEDFKVLHEPGFALAAMNFRLQDSGAGGCVLSTETRVYATDAASARKFARYWRVIYPGSALIRRMWRAIKHRAEVTPG